MTYGAHEEIRACISCDNIYEGKLKCPKCGAPGEPLDSGSFETDDDFRVTEKDIRDIVGKKLPNCS